MIKITITNKSIALFLIALLFIILVLSSLYINSNNAIRAIEYSKIPNFNEQFNKKIHMFNFFLKKQLNTYFELTILSQLYTFPLCVMASSGSAGLISLFDKPISLEELDNLYNKYQIKDLYYIKYISLHISQLSLIFFVIISLLSSLLAHLVSQTHTINPFKIIIIGLLNFLSILGVILGYGLIYNTTDNTVNKKIKLIYFIFLH